MKARHSVATLVLSGMILLLMGCSNASTASDSQGKLFYGIKQNDVLCGFVETEITHAEIDGRPVILLSESVEMHVKALGAPVDAFLTFSYHIDSASNMYFEHESKIDQGSLKLEATMSVEGDTVFIDDPTTEEVTKVYLPSGTLLENTRLYSHLLQPFADSSVKEQAFKIFLEVDGAVHDVTYTRLGEEEISVEGETYDALMLDRLDRNNGVKFKLWIDKNSGTLLRALTPVREVFLADEKIGDRVGQADIDQNIIARTDVFISNYKGLTFMKVSANLEPSGGWFTEESLNIPGQKFSGTVTDNLIEGVFEISHERYDGSGAPAFPPVFEEATANELEKYLDPEHLIESDDPALIAKASEITAGAGDSWDAMKRLAHWVSVEIGYDIPGGGSAINTYNTRLGECGSHSRLLAAFGRAVGIPCRMVWGCMYVPDFGGGFGQHAWNEVYMGDAGWIPVDATAEEIDYVDCGHIRIGVADSKAIALNPISMEILDYRPEETDQSHAVPDIYLPYIGDYQGERGVAQILVKNGGLALQLPERPLFELKDPDEEGRWLFKLTDRASVSFSRSESGEIDRLTISSRKRLPQKTEAPTPVDENAPEGIQPYLGSYNIPMQAATVAIVWVDGNLAMDAGEKGIIRMQGTDEQDCWSAKIGDHAELRVRFAKEEDSVATTMILDEMSHLRRITTGSDN